MADIFIHVLTLHIVQSNDTFVFVCFIYYCFVSLIQAWSRLIVCIYELKTCREKHCLRNTDSLLVNYPFSVHVYKIMLYSLFKKVMREVFKIVMFSQIISHYSIIKWVYRHNNNLSILNTWNAVISPLTAFNLRNIIFIKEHTEIESYFLKEICY